MRIHSVAELGELVRGERRQRALSQAELAQMVGVSRKWVADLEKGKESVDASLVVRTLAALELTLDVIPVRMRSSINDAETAALDLDDHLARLRERP